MYAKNEIEFKGNQRNVNQIVEDFINTRKFRPNCVLNSPAYTDCLSSLRSINMKHIEDQESISFSQFLRLKNKPALGSTSPLKQRRLNRKEDEMNKNVNVRNYRYIDVGVNQQMFNLLPKFKKIYRYNKRAEIFYTNKPTDTEDEFYKIGKANKLNVLQKVNEYKSYIKFFDNK